VIGREPEAGAGWRRRALVLGALLFGALVAVPGPAGAVTVAPSAVSFGPQEIDTESGPMVVTIYEDYHPPRALPSATARATGDFRVEPPFCRRTSCTVAVVFVPTDLGPRTGVLTILDDVGIAHNVPLSGDGEGAPRRMVGVVAGVVAGGGLVLAGRQFLEGRHSPARPG